MSVRSALTGTTRWTAKIPGKCGQVEATGTKYFVINKRVFDRRTGRVLWRPRGWSGWGATMGTTGEHAPVANGPALVVARKGTIEGRVP